MCDLKNSDILAFEPISNFDFLVCEHVPTASVFLAIFPEAQIVVSIGVHYSPVTVQLLIEHSFVNITVWGDTNAKTL